MLRIIISLCVLLGVSVHASVTVSNVTATLRPYSSVLDVYYDLASDTTNVSSVSIAIYIQDQFKKVASSVTGDVGSGVPVGSARHVVWDARAELVDTVTDYCAIGVEASVGPLAVNSPVVGMAHVPAGRNGSSSYEVHRDLFVDVYEVSKDQWDTVYSWAVTNGYAFDNAGLGKAADHPVHSINWYDCAKWCNARSEMEGLVSCFWVNGVIYKSGNQHPEIDWYADGYRLLSINEWSFAGKGGATYSYFPWGETISHSQANYKSSDAYAYDISPTRGYHPDYEIGATPYTAPVGSFSANGYGLFDVVGNVQEWCISMWRDDDSSRVASKGGNWAFDVRRAILGTTSVSSRSYKNSLYGFRTCRSALDIHRTCNCWPRKPY